MQKQISTIISLKDRFSGPLVKMSDNVKKLDQQTRSSMGRVNRWSNKVVRGVDKAVKATAKWAKRGAILGAGWSVKSGFEGVSELDYAARKVKSIAKDRLELDDIQKTIKDFSFEMGRTYEEVGESMYTAISASIPTDLMEEAVELGNQLSIAGFTDMESAVTLLASTMNAFDMRSSGEMQEMADQFLVAQHLGMITVDEMAHYYGRISTLSSQIGSSLEEQNAAIAMMTSFGMTEREAVTGYRSILNTFLKDTTDAQEQALEAMGLGVDFLTAKTFKELNFDGVVKAVADATGGDLDLVSEIFKDVRGKGAAAMFSPGSGLERYEHILRELGDAENSLENAYAEINKSVPRQWEIFKRRISNLNDELYTEEDGVGGYLVEQLILVNEWLDDNQVEIAEKINDTSRTIVEAFKRIMEFYKEHETGIKRFAKVLAGMYIFTKVTGWIGTFIDALGDVGQVIGGLMDGKLQLGGSIIGLLKTVGAFAAGAAKALIGVAVAAAPVVLEIVAIAGVVLAVFALIYGVVEFIMIWANDGFGAAVDNLGDRWGRFTGFISDKWAGVKRFFGKDVKVGNLQLDSTGWALGRKTIQEVQEEFSNNPVQLAIDTKFNLPKQTNMLTEVPTFDFGGIAGKINLIKEDFMMDVENAGVAYEDLGIGLQEDAEGELNLFGYDTFMSETSNAKSAYNSLIRNLNKPINANPSLTISQQVNPMNYIEGKYKGTPSWKGGPVKVHERGGEVMDVPGGTRIWPHDKSVEMAKEEGMSMAFDMTGGGQNISVDLGGINFSGDFNTRADIDEIGTKIVDTIKKELKNI